MKTFVFKVGTSTLIHPSGRVNLRRMEQLCKVLSDRANEGHRVVLVTSGAIGVGVGKLRLSGRPDGFRILFVAEGKCAISTEGYPQVALAADDSVLLPAGLSCEIVADGGCRLLISEP